MKTCERCSSTNIELKKKTLNEDLNKILKTFVCKDCKYEKSQLVDIDEEE